MIVTLRFDQMLEIVSPVIAQWTDQVVPGEVRLLPHNRYSPRYAWMFSFEKKLKYRIEETMGRPMGTLERELFGADGVFSEGLSNAFVHGHGRDPTRPIEIRCAVGRRGLAFSVSDGGSGFAVEDELERVQKGSPRFHFAGNGLRAFVDSAVARVSFADGGRRVNLLVAPFAAR